MRQLKRLSSWSDDHPVISIVVGFVALVVIGLVFLPPDPPYLNQNQHRSAT